MSSTAPEIRVPREPRSKTPFDGPRAAIEEHLALLVDERPFPGNLRDALRYALLGGGKRVRPVLTVLSCESVGGEAERALVPAAAIEMVHTFSLVHDDLPAMDDDDLRRGRPTLHRHADEATAILAGDALLGLAFEVLATRCDSAIKGELCAELAEATNDMIAGQMHDTRPDFGPDVSDAQRLATTHEHKTGALIRCACRMGAICGGADENALDAVTQYATSIGLMFQVVDDLLDETQTTEHLGKTARKDQIQGKLTYPALLGIEGSRAEVERLRVEAHRALEPLGPRARPLGEICEWLAVRTR